MREIDRRIYEINEIICNNIELIDFTSRGLVSQNVLSQSRHLIEHVAMKAYSEAHSLYVDYADIKASMEYIKTDNKFQFLRIFHAFLQESKSHYASNNDGAERLILKYYKYFVTLKNFVKSEYEMDILSNLDRFPIKLDNTVQDYYAKVAESLNVNRKIAEYSRSERYYVKKVKSFVVDGKVYYENVLTPVGDYVSKTDRFIVFSKNMIPMHYAINALIYMDDIEVNNNLMPINILVDFRVSIRPCELNNFAKIFGDKINIASNSSEYNGIMTFLTKSGASLTDVIMMSDSMYNSIRSAMILKARTVVFMDVLDKARKLILEQECGCNVIAYLLATLNNRVLKMQYNSETNARLSDLYLNWGCIPFDDMPFASNLRKHMPELSEIYGCISDVGREHELLGRYIQNNTKNNGELYTVQDEVECFGDVDVLINRYNNTVYSGHPGRKIYKFGRDKLYIKEDVDNTKYVINKLLDFSEKGIDGYEESISAWIDDNSSVDSDEKKKILKNMFGNSRVSLIYGAAGTGKTYLINHVSQYFDGRKKLFLANTHPAVENLRRSINAQNTEFRTVKKFILNRQIDTDYDVLIVDECSMISNSDMKAVLNKINCKLIILAGDTYQIESIEFGNWFELAKYYLKRDVWYELETPYRTKNGELLDLWKKVRQLSNNITENIVRNRYSSVLNQSIFEKQSDDEIILCLNYDGLYGINNINRFLQNNNPNKPYKMGVWIYKIGDPVLFNESDRFAPVLYNNLKGTIVNIEPNEDGAFFSIQIEKAITGLDAEAVGVELLNPINKGKSVIKFFVRNEADTDEDNQDKEDVIPFQVSYAVSIHKAQGLEYNSVKVVITQDVDEMITHNIFYTAITRTKEKLQIYWTPESQEKIISSFKKVNLSNVATIFSAHVGIKRVM